MPQPTFLVIGAQKCGTTSLYHYLNAHPNIFMSERKELHYFDREHKYPDVLWYESQFSIKDLDNILAIGEVTPIYCFWPTSLPRIYTYKPEMKLVMLVRDPVRRAISNYWMEFNRGNETQPIEQAFMMEESRLATGMSRHWRLHAYKKRSLYHEQLEHVHHLFPSRQIFTGRLEDLSRNPKSFMEALFHFLDVPVIHLAEYKRHFSTTYSPEAVPDDLLKMLYSYFRPHNMQLTRDYQITTIDWKISSY